MSTAEDFLEPQSDLPQEPVQSPAPSPAEAAPAPEGGESTPPADLAIGDDPATGNTAVSVDTPASGDTPAPGDNPPVTEAETPEASASEEAQPEDPDAAAGEEETVPANGESATAESGAGGGDKPAGLRAWWEEQSEEDRSFADLHDDGTLVLKAAGGMPERTLAKLTPEGKEATFKALKEKHAEVRDRVEKLRSEWDAAEDKGRLGGRMEGLREYLRRAPSLGNYTELYETLQPMEEEMARHAEASYAARLALIEEAEKIAEGTDWKAGTTALRDMTDRWKASPPLDKGRADELWTRLEGARDKFFERKRLANEELDKELMNNLSVKLELVDKAEALAASEEWRKTTEALKGLMDEWKSVGRAAGGRDEELWARFSAAKTVFFDRKKGHFDVIQKEQEENLAKKLALLERAEELQESTDWNKTSAQFEEVLQEWRRVGKVPIEKADELRDRMERAKDTFFGARRAHFETVKVSLTDNYAQKLALLKRAESLKNSTQWREATGEFTELMEEWKQIGPVPREHSRRIWQEFMAARSYFFDRKDADREKRNERFHQQAVARVDSQRQFLKKLEDELVEERDNLEDFRTSIGNITPGPKAKELHEHLTKLIAQSEERIGRKEAKLTQVRREVEAVVAPKPAPGKGSGREDRGRDDRAREGRGRDGNPGLQGERAQEFSADVPAGMPVEGEGDAGAANVTFTSSPGTDDGSDGEPSAPAGGGEQGAPSDEEQSSNAPRQPTPDTGSPDTVKDPVDTPPTGAETPAFSPNTDVLPPSAGEQNAAGVQAAGPDAVPSAETSTPPMQTGEDSGAVDEASATVD